MAAPQRQSFHAKMQQVLSVPFKVCLDMDRLEACALCSRSAKDCMLSYLVCRGP